MNLEFYIKHHYNSLLSLIPTESVYYPYYFVSIFMLLYFYVFAPSNKLLFPTFLIFYFFPILFIFHFFYMPFLNWVLKAHDSHSSLFLSPIFVFYFFCLCIAHLEVCESYEQEIKIDCYNEYLEEINQWEPYPKQYLDIVYSYSFMSFLILCSNLVMWPFFNIFESYYLYKSPTQFFFKITRSERVESIFLQENQLEGIDHVSILYYLLFLIFLLLLTFHIFFKLGSILIGDVPLLSEDSQEKLYHNYFVYFIPIFIYACIFWAIYFYSHEECIILQNNSFCPITSIDYHFEVDDIESID